MQKNAGGIPRGCNMRELEASRCVGAIAGQEVLGLPQRILWQRKRGDAHERRTGCLVGHGDSKPEAGERGGVGALRGPTLPALHLWQHWQAQGCLALHW